MKRFFFLFCYLLVAFNILQAQPSFLTLTSQGQGSGFGTISKYDAATNSISAIYTFGSEGVSPSGHLCKISNGKFYGMTTSGGTLGYGVIFSFDITTSNYKVVHNFNNINGAEPSGSLIQASDGKLYGITSKGGTSNGGVIFSLDPVTSVYSVLKNLDYNGWFPTGSLIQASDGKLYGMTSWGGTSAAGAIFSYEIGSATFTILKNFSNTDGAHPHGSLIQASDGKLYGMTTEGGNTYNEEFYIDPITQIPTYIITPGDGVIFSFDITTSAYNVLYNFNIANGTGANPYSSLLQASDGKLYGTTSRGSGGYGGVFSFDPISFNYVVLKKFDIYLDGAIPYGSLIQGSDDKLYGTLSDGGAYRYGAIFAIDIDNNNFVRQDFNGSNGSRPFDDLVEFENIVLDCISDTIVNAPENACIAAVYNIGPKISPLGSATTYQLTGSTTGSGNGSASGLQFNVGTTTVTYTATDDPTKTCSFNVTVNPSTAFYEDKDADGYGNASVSIYACIQPIGYVANNTDCNDVNPNIKPGTAEICNGIDDDCDGQIDEGFTNPNPCININDVTVRESDGSAVLAVTLSKASTSDILITYSTLDGTATSTPKGKRGTSVMADYIASSGNILIPAGSLSANIHITINSDDISEVAETFTVRLNLNKVNAKKATINDGTGLVTILNGSGNRISTSEENASNKFTQKLTVKTLPNPSSTYFTLITQSNQNQLISLRVYDILGRAIETRYNMPANNSVSIGHQYKAGLYYVEITQGNEKQTIKLIKSAKY